MKCLHAGMASSLVKTYQTSVRLVFGMPCPSYALSLVTYPRAAFGGYIIKYGKMPHFFGVILVGMKKIFNVETAKAGLLVALPLCLDDLFHYR